MAERAQAGIERRAPATVMRLSRLGSLHQCRLSFMRQLTRRMAREAWAFSRPRFDIDARGVGTAVYTAQGPERAYSLVAFAHDLPPEKRSDRVIAEAWDATFALFDGIPTEADTARLAQNVPLQEAGRVSERELSLSRANRSVRLWEHTVEALAAGRQPDPAQIRQVGYLMRTTAVYGSGKFGAADREAVADRPELQAPFQVEMLSVYLTRAFVRDLVEHMARVKGGARAAKLDAGLARRLGIGNSTGLGMAPFLVNHPVLFNNWIMAREEAIARVRSLETASMSEVALFHEMFRRSRKAMSGWHSQHPLQVEKLRRLEADLEAISAHLDTGGLSGTRPWNALIHWSETALSEEGQELLASLILEPYGDLVDGLACCMADSRAEAIVIDGRMTVAQVRQAIRDTYGWALKLDWSAPENCARAWYVSEEKLEPRLGERFEEPIEPYEQPLAPARDAAAAFAALEGWSDARTVAEFLLRHPEHRHTVRRAQMARTAPYSEIRDNTISAEVLPIDMLRAKLSFFGATHFDPRSDRWVRICMFAGAPYPDDLCDENADFWIYPGGEA
ncbi:hypothetical protein PSA7680_02775 [Pseudoruegeria aquimaris]|uniref:Uncharacterized protein n=1 Tax=Pseudoruegeria aquimaris TaxID=393663 RepID=A0A1Y5T1M2_9RHOB|nr:hypothetical protein [Pseudoruegeria aquimaris]SLN53405.1 hypothetical protein PSA7680_02775 [Pseudoruegeria aquimaris]